MRTKTPHTKRRRSKVQEKNVMWTCFKFGPIKNTFQKLWAHESLFMGCLQIYQQSLSLATFLRVHSNLKEVSYLSWPYTYPNLKTTWHIKLKFFWWTKILENLLLAKYLISVVATLIRFFAWNWIFFSRSNRSTLDRLKVYGGDFFAKFCNGWKLFTIYVQ